MSSSDEAKTSVSYVSVVDHGLTARQRIISTVLTPAGKDLAIVLFLKICDQINFLIQTKNMGTALIIPDPAI